jgi:hypothetical protein
MQEALSACLVGLSQSSALVGLIAAPLCLMNVIEPPIPLLMFHDSIVGVVRLGDCAVRPGSKSSTAGNTSAENTYYTTGACLCRYPGINRDPRAPSHHSTRSWLQQPCLPTLPTRGPKSTWWTHSCPYIQVTANTHRLSNISSALTAMNQGSETIGTVGRITRDTGP